jgi:uncharacterized lipoprotein YddW (UPF0748 family)
MLDLTLSRRQFIKLGSAVVLGSFYRPILSSAAGEPPMFESRAIMDEGLNWVTKKSAETVCERIKRAGFNVFIPCVWHGRGTIWPSKLAPWDNANQRIPGFDPLENLIKTASRFELEVHPWFTVALRQREFLEQFYDSGTPHNSFDVHRETFREFISSLILEVVSGYPIQGINLDFVRAVGICTSSQCIEDYKAKTQRDLLTDVKARGRPGADLKELIAWQEAAMGGIIRQISRQARVANKKAVISVDAGPGNPIVEIEGQNSMKWADEGLIDVIYAMNYSPNPDFTRIKSLQSQMKRPEAMVVLCGNYDQEGSKKKVVPRNSQKVVELLTQSRLISQGNGVCLYLYSMLNDEQIDLLSRTVFKAPAKPRWRRAVEVSS